MMTSPIKPSFEESIDVIDREINKRRTKWHLTALAWMDFDDVSQILRIHIHEKWHMYDPFRPLAPWINRVISNRIRNIIRNNHGNYVRPCLRCAAAEPDDLCTIYGKQCNACPLFATWEKGKKRAYNVKLPVPLENHAQEVFNLSADTIDIEKASNNLHTKMHQILKPAEWKVYKHLYVDGEAEDVVAKLMGYKTSEKNRAPGYKQLKNLKKSILIKVKKCLFGGEVDII